MATKIRTYISERMLEFLRTHEARLSVDGPAKAESTFMAEYLKATGCSKPRYGIDIAENRRGYSAASSSRPRRLKSPSCLSVVVGR